MSQPYEPYPVQPGQPLPSAHAPGYGAANPYYASQPVGQPKELTLTAILAAGSALGLTACAVVQAAVVADAVRTTDPTDPSFLVYGGSSLLYLLLLVASYVTTCLWLWRARHNSELIEPGHHHARSRGWVWGGWVCPIVNLWFPFQVVKGIHVASSRAYGGAGALIGWWWAAWLVFLFSMRASDSVATDAIDSGDVQSAEGVAVFAALLSVVALVLWVQVIRRTTRIQHEALGLG
jgi:hypothetical protein